MFFLDTYIQFNACSYFPVAAVVVTVSRHVGSEHMAIFVKIFLK